MGRSLLSGILCSREKNMEFSAFHPRIADLCPNSGIFYQEQGTSREVSLFGLKSSEAKAGENGYMLSVLQRISRELARNF
jgi:hypothetical protein